MPGQLKRQSRIKTHRDGQHDKNTDTWLLISTLEIYYCELSHLFKGYHRRQSLTVATSLVGIPLFT